MNVKKIRFKAVDVNYFAQNVAMESCMHGDGTLVSIEGGQFLESLSNYQLIRRDYNTWGCSV